MNRLFKAIIVDDEPAARRLMKNLLEEHQDVINVIGEASNGKEAIQKTEELKPDLIFLDIQMPDMTGFEVIAKLSFKPNIIFTTAYEQYAIKAFENFSIDYLLKPIREDRLRKSIEKLRQFGKLNHGVNLNDLQEIISQFHKSPKATALPVKTGDKIILLRFENIVFLEAQNKYVCIFTTEGQKHLVDQSLSALIEKLPEQFYRIQKSYIINKDRIREMYRHFNGRYLFIMDDKSGTRLTSGRTYADSIRKDFGL